MSETDPTIVRQAAAAFQAKPSLRFENLVPWKDVIAELRAKKASCHTIAAFLDQFGIQTSKSAIARFCRTVLNEPSRSRVRRKRTWPENPVQNPSAGTVQPESLIPAQKPHSTEELPLFPARPDPTTSTPRRRGPRIANIELIDD
jgi:hypothetical protein